VQAASNRTAVTGWVVAGATIAAIAIALPLAMVRAADDEPKRDASKVVQEAVPTTDNAQNRAASAVGEFGPVIERVVNDIEETDNQLLDVDTGKVSSVASGIRTGQTTPAAMGDWIRRQGTDLFFKSEVDGSAIAGVGLSLVGVDDSRWENGTPGVLRQDLRNGHPGLRTVESLGMRYYLLPRQPNLP
jgi:hypothetical protein